MSLFDADPKHRQIKDLRKSGYDGPIDQDGHKAETGPAADALDALRRRGADAR